MSTWEERMAARAAERGQRRAVAQAEIDARYPGAPEMPGHEGHHWHARGAGVECSCGQVGGVSCFVPDPRWWSDDPAEVAQVEREEADFQAWITCRICGQSGVMYEQDSGTWPPRTIPA